MAVAMHSSPVEGAERPLDTITIPQDAWTEFYGLDEAEEVPCTSLRKFLIHLYSSSTTGIFAGPLGTRPGAKGVSLLVEGPRCEDGLHHHIAYLVLHSEVSALTPAEKVAFQQKLKEVKIRRKVANTLTASYGREVEAYDIAIDDGATARILSLLGLTSG